ncbi:MAG: T9SS type A sorting domain-containing protein, partial [Bacteroidales bacterium]|nr:T9SS type A sorting domain-containing protein [Bacteroidales bacterium]
YVKSHVNVYAEHNRVHIINDYNVDIDNVSIYDMYGKLIYSGNAINNPEVIELNVAVGTYVVRLNTQQGPAVYKVHINR